ncbi:hypothetical protein K435DRAFT_600201, partial [Dendrothele bispora CBS 962.96]
PKKPSKGPSQHLIERIDHLRNLLHNLPDSLPLNPPASESTYHFALVPEDLEERGAFGAVSHSLEIGFGQQPDGILHFRERGERLEELIRMLKAGVKIMSDTDRSAFQSAWLERLINAAKSDGAKYTKRKQLNQDSTNSSDKHVTKKQRTSSPEADSIIVISDNEEASASQSQIIKTSSPSGTLATSSNPPIPTKRPMKPLPAKPVYRQQTLSFAKDTRSKAEKKAERQAEMRVFEERHEEEEERATRRLEQRKANEREKAREQQRRHRERLKAEKVNELSDREDINKVLMEGMKAAESTEDNPTHNDIAELSRAGGSKWREGRNGTLGGAVQGRAQRTNWYHPFLWIHISHTMVQADWQAGYAVKILQREHPVLFRHMHRGTIWRWKKKDERTWTERTLINVRNHGTLLGSGRAGALSKFPDLINEIKSTLLDLRKSGMVVNVPIARSIMLGIIQEKCPQALTPHFKCSESYVRDFFQAIMNWAPRAETRAAAKLPDDADDICERSFMRNVYAMKWYNIPPELVINGDQMGIYVIPNSSRTFHTKGDKQVDIVGKEEKRAFTIFVTSTPSGNALPFQIIWGGQSSGSLPSKEATGMDEAVEFGFDFTFAKSKTSPRSHFSTQKTMGEYLDNVIQPYIKQTIKVDPDLDDDQMSILFIDSYPVHTSQEFRTFIWNKYPRIILIFVPRNCTGKFQPADVGLQRPIKHFLKQKMFEWMVEVHRKSLAAGAKPEDIKITSLPKLRDASVAGLIEAYKYLSSPHGRSLIQKAWKGCVAKGYNLSEECLTSKKSQADLTKYLKNDPTLRNEIEERCGIVSGLDDGKDCIEADIDRRVDEFDDVDVPLTEIIAATFQE